MDYSFIRSIAEDYWNGEVCDISQNTREKEAFYETYITPEFEKDYAAGFKMDDMFLSAIAAEKGLSFKDGFRAGVAMMIECCVPSGKAVSA
ncbi:MAG: hypothetical protein ACI38A_02590 [Candidatus Ornithomonoglobus sp.]